MAMPAGAFVAEIAGVHALAQVAAFSIENPIPLPNLRRAVTTILFILISVMIVRDILVRRWSAPAPAASDVTRLSR